METMHNLQWDQVSLTCLKNVKNAGVYEEVSLLLFKGEM